jgi:polynucleotide 5'-hydroxyl-kinase GRC3/NOL9
MQTMAYFHAESATRQSGDDFINWFQKPLTAMIPWQVRFRDSGRGIFGILCYDFQTQPDFLADSINGSLLAAVEVESAKAFRSVGNNLSWGNSAGDEASPGSPMELDDGEASQAKSPQLSFIQKTITTLTPEGIPFIDTSHGLTLDPRYSRSLGLVLVRGIDIENGHLHLLGPITASQIEDVRARGGQIILVSGKFDPPSWAYTEDLYLQSEGGDGDGNNGTDLISQGGNVEDGVEDVNKNSGDLIDSNAGSVPWIEVLSGNQRRGAGSRVWRVRRDLGRLGNPAD